MMVFFLYGCSNQLVPKINTSTIPLVSTQSTAKAPSSQYIESIKSSIGGSSVSNIQLHYIRVLDSTHSLCLFTFEQGGQTLFNEICLSKENGEWKEYFSANPGLTKISVPYYNMSMGGSYGNGFEFFMVGGTINDPAVASIAVETLNGQFIRNLKIIGSGSLRLYAYGQLINIKEFKGWKVVAYDKYGSVISPSNTQLKNMENNPKLKTDNQPIPLQNVNSTVS